MRQSTVAEPKNLALAGEGIDASCVSNYRTRLGEAQPLLSCRCAFAAAQCRKLACAAGALGDCACFFTTMRLRPFQGLRPTVADASKIASLPYDVVTTEEARALAAGNPLSFLHVVRAEIDLPATTHIYDPAVYAQSKQAFDGLVAGEHMVREEKPVIYLYQQRRGTHVQVGIAATFAAEDYDQDRIKKHEKTRADKELDRTVLTRTLSLNTGPVFLTYRARPELDTLVERVRKESPLFDFTAVDGIQHTVWRVLDPAPFVKAFEAVPVAYIADGHHRAASYTRVARERKEANPAHNGSEEYNFFMAVAFPDNQLAILPYNRVVDNLNDHTPEALLAKLRSVGTVSEGAQPTPSHAGSVSVFLAGKWYNLEFRDTKGLDPVSSLDVSLLQNRVLQPFLGIDDPRTNKHIDFVGGIRGTEDLERRVNSGEAAIAFSMFPTTVAQLMDIADANQIMPPKSTWFEPKLRSGLFCHTF